MFFSSKMLTIKVLSLSLPYRWVTLFSLFMIFSIPVAALNSSALWLPAAYQKLAPELRQAALKLEADERCEKVLRGSLHDSTRSLEEATFLLICRDPGRRTFSVLADANTLELEFPIAEIQLAEEAVKSSDEVLRERVELLRGECEQLFNQKTRFMKSLHRIDEGAPAVPEVEGEQISFFMPFDAQSLQGNPLRYEAICSSAAEAEAATFSIRARRSSDS